MTIRMLIGVLLANCLSSGCGTMLNQSEPGSMFNADGSRRAHRIYGGVRSDVEMVWSTYASAFQGAYTAKESVSVVLFVPLVLVVDLPISAIADTAYLRRDVRAEIKWRRDGKPSSKRPDSPVRPIVPEQNQEMPEHRNALEAFGSNEFTAWNVTHRICVDLKQVEVAPMPRSIETASK